MQHAKHQMDSQGDAFRRAFEAAAQMPRDPGAWARLQQAVEDLVRLGAILAEEATDFETLLIMGGGEVGLDNDSTWRGRFSREQA